MRIATCPACQGDVPPADASAGREAVCPRCATAAEPIPATPSAQGPDDAGGVERRVRRDGPPPGLLAGKRARVVLAVVAVLGCCLGGSLVVALVLPAVRMVREAAARDRTKNRLQQIGVAFHSHHSALRALPAPKHDNRGVPVELSWRVSILPFAEQAALFQRFDQGQAWDSLANGPLTRVQVKQYQSELTPHPPTTTRFQVFTGPNTAFPEPGRQPTFADFKDGLSNTALAAESSRPVPWTKPADIVLEPNAPPPLPPLFMALMGDGSIRFVDRSGMDDAVLRTLIDPRDGR